MKILHLIIDEKFLEFSFSTFQAVEGLENKFVAFVNDPERRLAHVSNIPLWRVVGDEYSYTTMADEDISWCDVLVVHWWHRGAARVLARLPKKTVVVWSAWGGDYYDLLPGGEDGQVGDLTNQLMEQLHDRRRDILEQLRLALSSVKNFVMGRRLPNKLSLIQRIDYFSAPIRDDYDRLVASLGRRFRAEYVQLNYGSVEVTFAPGLSEICGENILLGNSATSTNYHLEAMQILATLDLGNRKIIVPLSYGEQDYAEEIELRGRRLLGSAFVPIRDFLPLEKYNHLISSCSVVIMNHQRQQALGNVLSMLCAGAKLFMDERSVIYQHLQARGVCVFPLRLIADEGLSALSPLSDSERQNNQEIIKLEWGHAAVLENVKVFAKRMRQEVAQRA